jgi:adenylosuccinate synthase
MREAQGKIIPVVGGQYGSEGKGAVTAALAARIARAEGVPPAVVRVAGPNAGHSAIGERDGRKWALRQVPVAAVTSGADLFIAAGSEIDPPVLEAEVRELDEAGYEVSSRLWVDTSATVIDERHKEHEASELLRERAGSTVKGIGAARADRVMRWAKTWGEWVKEQGGVEAVEAIYGHPFDSTARTLNWLVDHGQHILIEGTQGYGLGLHGEHYPQCTSSDCRAIDFMAMAGLNAWGSGGSRRVEPWVVLRVHPIRVAGNSGPLHAETTWGQLGLPEELTTVTQKVRRVGGWDPVLAYNAVQANGGEACKVALTMVDTVVPELAGRTDLAGISGDADLELKRWVDEIRRTDGTPGYLGTGPDTGIWLDQ